MTPDEREVLERVYWATREPYAGIASDIRAELAWLLGIEAQDHAVEMSENWPKRPNSVGVRNDGKSQHTAH